MDRDQLFLGADVGTSSLKLILIDGDGHILKHDSVKYELASPHAGWTEIDPESWIDAFVKAANALLTDEDRKKLIRIGVTGQMHTLVLLGKNGKAIRPAMMWNDLRTKELIPAIRGQLEKFSDGKYLAKIISTGSPLANLIWVKNEEPEVFGNIRKIQIGWDYVVYRLTNNHCTDFCNASTSCLFSFETNQWSEEIREFVGLDSSCYPECMGSAEIAGCLSEEFCQRLNLTEKVQVIVGTGDNPAAALSTGGYWSESPILSIGTSGVITRIFSGKENAYSGKKIQFAFRKGEFRTLEQGAVQSCGNTYDWWNKQSREPESKLVPEDIRSRAANKLLFYPHLAGEKTLFSDSRLSGMFVGLDLNTDQKDMQYAVCEGICFSIRELIDKLYVFEKHDASSLSVVGGASDNEILMQTLANVLGRRVEKLNSSTGAVYGIAFLAANAFAPDKIADIKSTLKKEKMYLPEESLNSAYDSKYACYLRIRKAIHYIYGYEESMVI